MVGLYGPLIFNLPFAAAQNMKQTTVARWTHTELLGQFPVSQFIGPGQGTFSLSLLFFRGDTTPLELAHTLIESFIKGGKDFPLILGMRMLGSFTTTWIIENSSASYNIVALNGSIVSGTIDCQFKEVKRTIGTSSGGLVGAASRMLSNVSGGFL